MNSKSPMPKNKKNLILLGLKLHHQSKPRKSKLIKFHWIMKFWMQNLQFVRNSLRMIKQKKNTLILIAKNLNKIQSRGELEKGINKHMGKKNMVSTFFRLEKGKHVSTCNVQCLNVAMYKKFSKEWKNIRKVCRIQFTSKESRWYKCT